MKKLRILLISTEAWGQNFVSKHHYASFLAEQHEVFFLCPAIGFTTVPFGNMEISSQQINPNLQVIRYKNLLPKLNAQPAFIRSSTYRKQAERLLEYFGAAIDLVWSFDPRRFNDQAVWGNTKSIYHSVDLHPDADEKKITESSDVVIALSERICNGLSRYNSGLVKIGHGSHVEPGEDVPEKITLPGSNTVKAIYTGNFHRHIDYPVMTALAGENRDVDFILVGPTEPNNLSNLTIEDTELEQLKKQPNIFFTGSVPGAKLISYIAAADICLVLFKKEFEHIHHAPHKLMAYFAAGKVVVSNPIEEHADSPGWLMQMADMEQINELFAKVKRGLAEWNSEALVRQRKQYAAKHHYRNKIKEILDLVEKS